MRAEGFWEVRTEHVRLRTDVPRAPAEELARHLESTHRALASSFFDCAEATAAGRVDVTVLARRRDFEEVFGPLPGAVLLHSRGGAAPEATMVVMNGEELVSTVVYAHELTHRFVAACFPDAPPWLHEGLASFFETVAVRDGQILVGVPSYALTDDAERAQLFYRGVPVEAVPRAWLPSASELVAIEDWTSVADERAFAGRYAAAWALVHRLMLGPDAGERVAFARYLEALHDARVARAEAFEGTLATLSLDAVLIAATRATEWSVIQAPFDATEVRVPDAERLAVGRAHLLWASMLARSGQPDAHDALVEHLRLAVESEPERTEALVRLAVLSGGREGEAMLRSADQRDARHPAVLHARAAMALEGGASGPLAESLASQLSAAPELGAASLAVLAELQRRAGHTAEAARTAQRAVRADAGSIAARLALARALRDAGEGELARSVYRIAANLASHGDAELAADIQAELRETRSAERKHGAPMRPRGRSALSPRSW